MARSVSPARQWDRSYSVGRNRPGPPTTEHGRVEIENITPESRGHAVGFYLETRRTASLTPTSPLPPAGRAPAGLGTITPSEEGQSGSPSNSLLEYSCPLRPWRGAMSGRHEAGTPAHANTGRGGTGGNRDYESPGSGSQSRNSARCDTSGAGRSQDKYTTTGSCETNPPTAAPV